MKKRHRREERKAKKLKEENLLAAPIQEIIPRIFILFYKAGLGGEKGCDKAVFGICLYIGALTLIRESKVRLWYVEILRHEHVEM